MIKNLSKDLKAISRKLKTLSKKTEKIIILVEKIEKQNVVTYKKRLKDKLI